MIRVAIVEDEDIAARQLEQCLQQYESGHDIRFSSCRFRDALEFLEQYQPLYDLIFMDIGMPGLDGMEAAVRLRAMDSVTPLIFVTSMVQYAVRGYEVDALDFVVKPVRYPTFELKLRRALRAAEMRRGQEVQISVGGVTRVMPSADICYIEVMDHDLTYHTQREEIRTRGKLSAVEQRLPADTFSRCSVSFLINLRYVERYSGESVWVAGRKIPLSRGKKKELMAALAAYLGRGV